MNTDCTYGCPRPADHGQLCAWCWQRLNNALYDIPDIITHLHHIARSHVEGIRYDKDNTSSGGDPSERTVLHPAWLAGDELMGDIRSWAQVILEEHQPALKGPNSDEWAGDVLGWVHFHIGWAADQDWIADMRTEIPRTVATINARWPHAERARDIPDAMCPGCDQISLKYWPPTTPGQEAVVECSNPACARIFTKDEWERRVQLIAQAEGIA